MNLVRRALRRIAAAVAAAATSATFAPIGHTTTDEIAVNGTLHAVSDGQWAKTNEIFHDEETVSSIWTVSSSCSGVYDCTGRVTSDQGWSAEARYVSNMWFVTRTIPDWQRCADGSTAAGKQIVKFYRDASAPSTFKGWDTTVGPSGACGVNLPLAIEMPFTLRPL